MDVFNSKNLLDALWLCDEPGVSVGIACRTQESVSILYRSFFDLMRDGELSGWRISKAHSMSYTLYKPGDGFRDRSVIRIFNATIPQEIHGLSFHKILYESGMDDRTIEELCQHERLECNAWTNADSIDDFLGSFKII